MENENVIILDAVTKVLGKKPRIEELSFSCSPGKVYGLLGPNGAGKTTLMNLITGLYRPTSGTVRVLGLDPVRDAKRVRREIGLVPQETALYPELSARENLRFHAALYMTNQSATARRIEEVLELVDLADRANEPVRAYSGGMKRRLALGRAMLANPRGSPAARRADARRRRTGHASHLGLRKALQGRGPHGARVHKRDG